MITGIGHTAYTVKDLARAEEFYVNVLGLKRAFAMNNEHGEVSMLYLQITGHQFIELFPYSGDEAQTESQLGYKHLCLEVDDITAAMDTIKKRGGTIDRPIMKGKSGCLQLWISDPDGNKIELMQMLDDSMQMKTARALESN